MQLSELGLLQDACMLLAGGSTLLVAMLVAEQGEEQAGRLGAASWRKLRCCVTCSRHRKQTCHAAPNHWASLCQMQCDMLTSPEATSLGVERAVTKLLAPWLA